MTSGAPAVRPAVGALREDLIDATYTVGAVQDSLGTVAAQALHREQTFPAERATRDPSPVATLVRLFSLGLPLQAERVEAAVPRCGVGGLVDLGLAAVVGGMVHAACDLRPYADDRHDWWVASDLSEIATGRPLETDHVLGIGGASTTLASWTPRRPAARALDLGTGCGVQSLHLAGHSDAVVGTDLSTRALAYARFNAALNGIELDVRAGSLLEPVADEAFDLIVSNPPFVITPRVDAVPEFEYRDGGQVGDALVRGLIGDLYGHLNPGGVAQLLANWEVPAGHDWTEVLGDWLAGSGLDAWVVQRETQDPAEYAELWSGDGGHRRGEPGFDRMYAAWLDDFASRDVERVGFGIVTLQRPARERATFLDLVDVRGPVAAAMGPAIDAGLRARTWIAEHGDAELLDTAWRVAPDVTEERHGRPGAQDPSVIVIRQGGGLGRAIRADTALAAYVSVCDGDLTARQALDAIASLLDVGADALRNQALPEIRELVADGLLTPEGGGYRGRSGG
ncbi:DUF7059 domain-containing protein [Leekyejoonella antrihumi]|uniref:Methyltransferase n=1 Tax=Leekyejoonella antrihumi TaxID=1660198 RepID=A0A563DVK4_9MICO|nr:methyltransferase [Leekyejoonella antrihumi]TWP34300.1 methyltransferase [Leekyejoonella antrihumi]